MKTVLLMRHSIAASDNPAWTDRERPLTEAGRELAKATAEILRETTVDRIVCSSATRTTETAELIAKANEISKVDQLDDLYLARPDAYVELPLQLVQADDDSVLVVGHNPGIASLIYKWAVIDTYVSPGTVAVFDFAVDDWCEVKKAAPELTTVISGGRIITAGENA